MRGKMARSAAHPPFPTVHVAAAVRATACLARTPENRKNSHWFGGSYGESRVRRDAGSGVLNFNFDAFRLGLDPYDELSFRPARHRLYGVNGEVNKDLLKLNPISQHLWQLVH